MLQQNKFQDAIIIVSGLPRSGTSMMMKILESGGLSILTDNLRTADEDNPKGYYEFEKVKQVKNDQDWLQQANGKVVKIISALLKDLPSTFNYKVIFMRRNMDEILASQKKMLIRRGEATDKVSDEKMTEIFENHLQKIEAWLKEQPNFKVIYIHYNETLQDPEKNIHNINCFLNNALDEKEMMKAIDERLYRNKA